MAWQNQLNGDSLSWLLEDNQPEIQYLAFRDLLDASDNDEKLAKACETAHTNGPIAQILNKMEPGGYWIEPGAGYNPKYRSTVWSILLLAQLGAHINHDKRILQACTYILDHALTEHGQFSSSGTPSGTMDCLQGNLCWALLELGCEDTRLQKAFEWMARSVTGEGVAPQNDHQANIRYYAGKCGPNFACGANYKLPCAWGAVKVMLAFGKLPEQQRTPLITQATNMGINFLLGVDPITANYPTGYANKPSTDWWKFGFPVFYITDILQIAEVLVHLGLGNDPRLKNLMQLIKNKQDANGRWPLEYDYTGKTWINFGEKKQPNKWVTLRALRVLKFVE